MIKNYIFDFGNVLARFDPQELTAACVKNSEKQKSLADIVFDRKYWDRLDAGTITDAEAKAGFCENLPPELHEDACAIYDNWVKNLPPVDGMPELVKYIKDRGGKLYLLSNISHKFAAEYKDNPWINDLFSYFDGLLFSVRIGIVKPAPAIFSRLLESYGLVSEESVFIDDNSNNVAAATALGIHGILFDGNAEALKEQLNFYLE